MSIPLDRLYHYLDSVIDGDVIIYRFFPHGSKNLNDLAPLALVDSNAWSKPYIICHDQEPLNFDFYTLRENVQPTVARNVEQHKRNFKILHDWYYSTVTEAQQDLLNSNLAAAVENDFNLHDNVLLVHSEKRSADLDRYQKAGYIGVYWWSHAVIALDWYRYAQHDPELIKDKNIQWDFLIYNRAWSGTREYRLKFSELLIDNNLADYCNTKFNPIDNDVSYLDHAFENAAFRPNRRDIEQHFPLNNFSTTASADYCSDDYHTSGIEVVLETLFDDQRLHLTEKSLRPIACGQPFILAGPYHGLKYLQSYGFETFQGLINENYDDIVDPVLRLNAIVAEMKRISVLSKFEKQNLFLKLQKIAARNKQKFFSKDFFTRCVSEFKQNANQALDYVRSNAKGQRRQRAFDLIKEKYQNEFDEFIKTHPDVQDRINKLNQIYNSLNR